jgi:hypothetical protein
MKYIQNNGRKGAALQLYPYVSREGMEIVSNLSVLHDAA